MDMIKLNEILRLHKLWLDGKAGGVRANLGPADLAGVDLRSANLVGANLECAYLEDANLVGANLEGANLLGANLKYANLEDANLEDANLKGANLRSANLLGANLRYAYLEDANLVGANLKGADLDFSCWPLFCGSLGVKADAQLVGQLLYHVLDLARSSGVDIEPSDRTLDLANNSSPVTKHGKSKI